MSFTHRRKLIVGAVAAMGVATLAHASAPQPRQPIDPERFAGRWYEIARTPNRLQPTCQRLAIDFARTSEGFDVTNTCTRANGNSDRVQATARITDSNTNAKMRMTARGVRAVAGSQEYWVLDRANDYSWAIMATPGGNYFWLWARNASPSASQRQAMLARVQALGYNTSNAVVTGG